MGEVIDFIEYKEKKEILLLTDPCSRPYHHDEYIRDCVCRRCGVQVKLEGHPSKGLEWYG